MHTTPHSPSPFEPVAIFSRHDLLANAGVCALINDVQVAVFYLPDESPMLYAIHNWDPLGRANVLYRGIVGDIEGELVVASPLYKQHFSLQTGRCLEDPVIQVPVYEAQLEGDTVTVSLRTRKPTLMQDTE